MIHIVVDDQQAKLISESNQYVEIRDPHGKHLGFVAHRFTEDDLALAKERFDSDQPRLTTEQMLSRLRSLGTE